MKQLLTIILMLCSAQAYAQCTPNLVKADVCQYAQKAAAEMHPLLPIKMSPTMAITEVFAVGATLNMNIQLSYTQKILQEKAGGTSLESIRVGMSAAVKRNWCQTEKVRAFINLGGIAAAAWKFSDGRVFLRLEVSSCEVK